MLDIPFFAVESSAPETFLGIGLGLLALIAIFVIVSFIFWVVMLAHAIQHNSEYKWIWIGVLLVSFFTGFALIGAIVYYFVEKKRIDQIKREADYPPSV